MTYIGRFSTVNVSHLGNHLKMSVRGALNTTTTARRIIHLAPDYVNLPAPPEDILIPLLLQHCLILLLFILTIVVLVVALLLRPL